MNKINLPNPRYIRQGKCNRCGWCCEYHGCPDVAYNKDGKAVCTIYETRPQRCVVFPEAPPILHKGCGFWFLDTWEDNKKVKYGWDL
jgi:TPP-dependent indolepyruvate ferredoxin oxidoreductase alpha subunit